MRRFLPSVVIVATFLFHSCPTTTPEYTSYTLDLSVATVGSGSTVPPDFAGFCHAGYSNNLDREYDILDETGAVWVHRDFTWSSIERTEGVFSFDGFDSYVQRANAEDKKVMGMLLYDNDLIHDICGNERARKIYRNEIPYFCKYVVETVERYNGNNDYGKVDAWLIWNEPNYDRFWKGTPGEFLDLTLAVAAVVRNLDQNEGTHTTLLGGVFYPLTYTGFVPEIFTHTNDAIIDDLISGNLLPNPSLKETPIRDLIDGIAFHPYGPNALGSLGAFNNFKQMVADYGFADKIWLNEMGYPTYSDKGVLPTGRYGSDQYEGDMPEVVVKTFTVLAAAGARNLTWYHLFDGADRDKADSEHWFGLVWRQSDDNWVKKGGYWGYALCAKNLPGMTYKEKDFGVSIDRVRAYYFEGDDGQRALIAWNNSGWQTIDLTVNLNGSNFKLWNPETGNSTSVGRNSTHTLYPRDSSQRSLLFFTWQG